MARGFGATRGTASTDVITSALISHASSRTYAFWIKASTIASSNRIFEKGASGFPAETFHYDSGADRYYYIRNWDGAAGLWRISLPGDPTAWHHIAVTYDGSSTSNDPIIYLNGSDASALEVQAPSGTIVTNSETYRVGNRGNQDSVWDGDIAEFAVWDAILTSGNISTLYNGGAGAAATGINDGALVEYLRMHDNPVTSSVISNPTVTGTALTTHPFSVATGNSGRVLLLGVG